MVLALVLPTSHVRHMEAGTRGPNHPPNKASDCKVGTCSSATRCQSQQQLAGNQEFLGMFTGVLASNKHITRGPSQPSKDKIFLFFHTQRNLTLS